jgi:hypothetical protein
MSLLATVIFAFMIGFTGSAQEATEAPVQASQVQQIVEHDPILEMDAEVTLDDYNVKKEFSDERGNDYIYQYVGSDGSSDSMYGEFTYESIDFPGTFHHYVYSPLSHT